MADPAVLKMLKSGVDEWNSWRDTLDLREHRGYLHLDLSGADLRRLHLPNADLSSVDLERADLRDSDLSGAVLNEANCAGASFKGVSLTGAFTMFADFSDCDFRGADLERTDFREANLDRANFTYTDLTMTAFHGCSMNQTDMSFASLDRTSFSHTDLSNCIGLDLARHRGPTSIGVDTLVLSNGKLSHSFLLSAGLPELFIDYLPSLIGGLSPIQFYSCFISYSTKDEEFAQRLHADLRSARVRCWFAPEDVKGGRKLHEQIDHAIRVHDRLLLVLSEASMASEWVNHEIWRARQREKAEGRRVLFPITLVPFERLKEWEAFDSDIGKDMGREVREYFVPDFSNWKHDDSYQPALARLLRDLKAEAEGEFGGGREG